MEKNNKQYSKVINDRVEKLSGHSSESSWDLCARTNSTYLDCPVATKQDSEEPYTMSVAIHNPSANSINHATFAVEHGNYDVKGFNSESQEFENVPAEVLCY